MQVSFPQDVSVQGVYDVFQAVPLAGIATLDIDVKRHLVTLGLSGSDMLFKNELFTSSCSLGGPLRVKFTNTFFLGALRFYMQSNHTMLGCQYK